MTLKKKIHMTKLEKYLMCTEEIGRVQPDTIYGRSAKHTINKMKIIIEQFVDLVHEYTENAPWYEYELVQSRIDAIMERLTK